MEKVQEDRKISKKIRYRDGQKYSRTRWKFIDTLSCWNLVKQNPIDLVFKREIFTLSSSFPKVSLHYILLLENVKI